MSKRKKEVQQAIADERIFVINLDGEQLIFATFEDVPDDYDGVVNVYQLVQSGKLKVTVTRTLE